MGQYNAVRRLGTFATLVVVAAMLPACASDANDGPVAVVGDSVETGQPPNDGEMPSPESDAGGEVEPAATTACPEQEPPPIVYTDCEPEQEGLDCDYVKEDACRQTVITNQWQCREGRWYWSSTAGRNKDGCPQQEPSLNDGCSTQGLRCSYLQPDDTCGPLDDCNPIERAYECAEGSWLQAADCSDADVDG